ncbi:MAG: hypothetical protein ACLTC5_06105 [Subdoligranulum sp.]
MSYRAFWQRRCRAAAAGAVLKPQGGNCAVLPYICTFPGLWPGFACRFILTLIVIVPPRPVKLPAYFPLAVPFYFSNFLCFLAFVLSAGPFLCCFSDFSAYAVLFISLLQPICTKLSHKTVNLHTSAQNFCATF